MDVRDECALGQAHGVEREISHVFVLPHRIAFGFFR